ncbi:hypothetical protein K474DRAFT_1661533 [Panus rudis PR-1116 ss-1]|nr:hypothetical protein K474DRAFT_1661533 [Panus rudis PR-1116 ss-1]
MDVTPDFVHFAQLNKYTIAASMALLYWDLLLTTPEEIQLYGWLNVKDLTWTTFCYYLNRYSAVVMHVPIAFEYFLQLSNKSCHALQHLHQIYCLIAVILVGILQIIRTYALYGKRRMLLYALALIAVSCIALACVACLPQWAITSVERLPRLSPRKNQALCSIPFTQKQNDRLAIAWASAMVFDTIIFSLALYKRLRIGKSPHNGLFSLMLRDGTVYYG